MLDNEIKKLEGALVAPWERVGLEPEMYIRDLTVRLQSITALMKSGKVDKSVVKSSIKDTLTDTIEFIAWAQSKRELTSAVALIRTYMNRIKDTHDNHSNTKRVHQGS